MIKARGQTLNVYDLINEMNSLKKDIYSLATLLEINVSKIRLQPITIKDIFVKGGMPQDKMANYMIQDEKLKSDLENKIESYNSYRDLTIVEIKKMQANKSDDEMIAFYRDTLKWKWHDIAKIMNYSIRQSQRKYNKFKSDL